MDDLPTMSPQALALRAKLLRTVRQFFDERGYIEVDTPLLSADIVVDAWLEPIIADYRRDALSWQSPPTELRYLQTSPEFAMKRLLAGGCTAIYQLGKVFRNGETGRRHNPEFTMVEWYRVGDSLDDQMAVVEELVCHVLDAAVSSTEAAEVAFPAPSPPSSGERVGVRGQALAPPPDQAASAIEAGKERTAPSPYPSPPKTGERGPNEEQLTVRSIPRPFERLPYDDAFLRHAGRAVLTVPVTTLHDLARQHQLTPPPGLDANDRDGWLNWLLAELVEPKLGHERPVLLCDYPPTQAALARTEPRADGQLVAKRFELYIAGVEYCNGYDELTDADVLCERNRQENAKRQAAGLRPLPEESRLLAAMERGLPPCSGVAFGFDRLAMLAMGADRIEQVIPFPWERA